jgi:hypothetical protein
MDDELLAKLLVTRIPRGMRCATCAQWAPDLNDDQIGYCAEHGEDTVSIQGCVYWLPVRGCGLDYMGVPVASPLAQGGIDAND